MCSAVERFPRVITLLITWVTSGELWTASGTGSRIWISARRGISDPSSDAVEFLGREPKAPRPRRPEEAMRALPARPCQARGRTRLRPRLEAEASLAMPTWRPCRLRRRGRLALAKARVGSGAA